MTPFLDGIPAYLRHQRRDPGLGQLYHVVPSLRSAVPVPRTKCWPRRPEIPSGIRAAGRGRTMALRGATKALLTCGRAATVRAGTIQIACAVEAAVDAIITRDPRGFAGSP